MTTEVIVKATSHSVDVTLCNAEGEKVGSDTVEKNTTKSFYLHADLAIGLAENPSDEE